ncbi:MAG: 2-polyprenyl-3-methyl-5-hydroxy-6-metoxy-1,4-benzoquinol methylase, partial [Lysobacterales bacterium]
MDIKYWNSFAHSYDQDVLEIIQEDSKSVLKKEIMALAKKEYIAADMGCGRGSLLPLLSSKFKQVYALDYAKDLINQAQIRHSYNNISYIQRDLTRRRSFPFKVDVTFCLNALIHPSNNIRQAIARSIYRATKIKGYGVFVVPSMESILNTYQMMLKHDERLGKIRQTALKGMERLYANEVISTIDGIVNIGGELTKCFMQQELDKFLTDVGYAVESIK